MSFEREAPNTAKKNSNFCHHQTAPVKILGIFVFLKNLSKFLNRKMILFLGDEEILDTQSERIKSSEGPSNPQRMTSMYQTASQTCKIIYNFSFDWPQDVKKKIKCVKAIDNYENGDRKVFH